MTVNEPTLDFHETKDLDRKSRLELFEFCDRYSSRRRSRFESQLEKEQLVFFVRGDRTEHLLGFGTASVLTVSHEDQLATILYTGWAMIDPAFRGKGIIQRAALRLFSQERLRHPSRPIYWLFTSSTLNSYLLAVRNFPICYPREGLAWPAREKAYVEQGLKSLGIEWDPSTGVVPRGGTSFYREGVIDASDRSSSDPDVAFYARTNPGQANGDTLVVFAPLDAANIRSAAWRMIRPRKKTKKA